jgi:FMN reductase
MKQRTLVVVSSGLSQPSSTRLLADQLAASTVSEAAERGIELRVEVIELRDLAHDIMNNLLTGFPPANLREALDLVIDADALIAVSPIFSASYAGLFKSFFDVVDKDALVDKPVLIAATAGTARHSLALEHSLRPLFAYLRATTVPTSVFAATDDWGSDSAEGFLQTRVARAAQELVTEIDRREPVAIVDPFALNHSFRDML